MTQDPKKFQSDVLAWGRVFFLLCLSHYLDMFKIRETGVHEISTAYSKQMTEM